MSLTQPPGSGSPGPNPPATPVLTGPLPALFRRHPEFVDALGIRAGTLPPVRALREHVREPYGLR